MPKELAYLKTLLAHSLRENPLLAVGIVLSLAGVGAEMVAMLSLLPLSALAVGHALDAAAFPSSMLENLGIAANIRNLLLFFSGFFALRILLQFAAQTLTTYLGRRIHAQLSSRAFQEIITNITVAEIEKNTIGHYISLAGDESFRVSSLVIAISQFTTTAVLGLLYYAAIVHFSLPLGLAVAVFLAVSLICLWRGFGITHALGNRQVEQSRLAGSIFIDALNGLRGVRAFGAEAHVTERYREEIYRYTRTLFHVDFVSMLSRLIPGFILVGLLFAAVATDSTLLSSGQNLPGLLTSIVFLLRFFPAVGQSLNLLLRIHADARSGRDLVNTLGQRDAAPAHLGHDLAESVSRIQFRDIGFSYVPGKPVIHRVSLQLEKGKSYALVGASGSGKSTLIDLLMGFYAPDAGQILINGTDAQTLNLRNLRKKILIVGQQVVVFNETVEENIRFGRDATHAQVERAAQQACIEEVIAALDAGYSTKLQYRGTNLSGGQVQRIGLSRALLRTPDVLILDECTNALDTDTRQKVVANILREFADKIVVFVTHDPEIVRAVNTAYDIETINKSG